MRGEDQYFDMKNNDVVYYINWGTEVEKCVLVKQTEHTVTLRRQSWSGREETTRINKKRNMLFHTKRGAIVHLLNVEIDKRTVSNNNTAKLRAMLLEKGEEE